MGGDLFYALTPWEPSVTATVAIICTALLYLRGLHMRPTAGQQIMFWSGLLLFYAMLLTQFDYYAEHAFFMHRLQHSVLHHVAPFLMALSRPGAVLMAGMPVRFQAALARASAIPAIRNVIDFINRPAVAVTLFCCFVVIWLVPPVHFIVMLDWRWYRAMNWAMVVDGLMFWNLVLNDFALRQAALSATQRSMMMLAVVPPQIAAGLVLFLAQTELYPVYAVCGRAFASLSPLADQQLGGLVIWNGVMMSVIGIVIVIRRGFFGRSSFA